MNKRRKPSEKRKVAKATAILLLKVTRSQAQQTFIGNSLMENIIHLLLLMYYTVCFYRFSFNTVFVCRVFVDLVNGEPIPRKSILKSRSRENSVCSDTSESSTADFDERRAAFGRSWSHDDATHSDTSDGITEEESPTGTSPRTNGRFEVQKSSWCLLKSTWNGNSDQSIVKLYVNDLIVYDLFNL